jgi:hypothetical protein
MKNYILNLLTSIAILFFYGCTKDDFTWNLKKRPCVISFSNSTMDYFERISVSNMLNETLGSGPTNYFKDKSIIVTKGSTYSLNVRFKISTVFDYVAAYAYFDWNCDGDFLDSNESVLISDDINIKDVVKSIVVPNDAVKGNTVARFILKPDYYSTPGSDPCLEYGDRGEVEDYPLVIQ